MTNDKTEDQKLTKSKTALIIIAIIVLAILAIFLLTGSSSSSFKDGFEDGFEDGSNSSHSSNEDSNKNDEDKVKSLLSDSLGKDFISADVVEVPNFSNEELPDGSNSYTLKVDYNFASVTGDKNDIKSSFTKIAKAVKTVQARGYNVLQVAFFAKGELADQYGNSEQGEIMSLKIDPKNMEKINWEETDTELGFTVLYNLAISNEINYSSTTQYELD